MIKLNTYSVKGVKKPSISLPRELEVRGSKFLLAQAIRVYEDRLHPGLAKVKTRGEVAYSTRKIYRQKGTGGARHGSRGAPIFVGGGKAHGPTGIKRELKLPRKIGRKALNFALTLKAKNGELILIDNVSFLKKTKEVNVLIKKILYSEKKALKNSRFTFVLSAKNKDAKLALRNFKGITVFNFRNLNAHKVFYGGIILLDKDALEEAKKLKNKKTLFRPAKQSYEGQAEKPRTAQIKKATHQTK